MEDLKILWQKIKHFYKAFCQEEWNPTQTGIVVAILTILIMAWWRPWGAVGAVRNWGDWMLYSIGLYGPDRFIDEFGDPILTQSILFNTGQSSVSASLAALLFPPVLAVNSPCVSRRFGNMSRR
jgi:uncharacterized protein